MPPAGFLPGPGGYQPRVIRAPALIAALAILALAGCTDGDGGDGGTATVTQTVVQTATDPAAERRDQQECGNVVFSPNSGDAAFDVTTENVSCQEAERLLRSRSGLQSWRCSVIARAPGQQTTRCSEGDRVIVFVTEP